MATKFVELEEAHDSQLRRNSLNDQEKQVDNNNQNTQENTAPTQAKEKKINKYQALFTQINVMLGVGPLILPSVFYESGIVLAGFFLIFIGFFSYISGEFLVEGMSICNYIQGKKNAYERTQVKTDEEINDQHKHNNNTVIEQNLFELNQKFEYGEMGEILINKSSKLIISIIIIMYIIGVLIMKCMATAKVTSKVFEQYDILGSYNLWLISFFVISCIFSFKNVQDTQKLQSFIFYVRILTVIAMLIGCFYTIYLTGLHPLFTQEYPAVSFKGFNHLFSNAVFAYNMHHSIPSMSKPIHPSRDIKKVFMSTFTIAITIFFSLCISGILAFGDSLVEKGDLKLFNFNFKEHSPFVYYFSGFYVFLNITAFPVMTITSRNNLLALVPSLQNISVNNNGSHQLQNSNGLTLPNIIGSLIILLPVFFISMFANSIQIVLNVIGGIFGALMLSIIPSLLVIQGRKKLTNLTDSEKKDFFHQTIINSKALPLVILLFGCLSCIYNSYLVFHELFL